MHNKAFEYIGRAAAVLTVVAAGFGAVSAARLVDIPSYEGNLSVCGPTYHDWIEFIEFAIEHEDEVAIVDMWFLYNRCPEYVVRRTEGSSTVSRNSGFWVGPWIFDDPVRYTGLREEELWEFVPDNGTSIILNRSDVFVNSETEILLYVEASGDRVRGPINFAVETSDGARSITLNAPIISDDLRRSVACAARDWAFLRKVIFCPFL